MDENCEVWYRGNDGKPMKKLHAYSSWNMDAIYNRYLVNEDKELYNKYVAGS